MQFKVALGIVFGLIFISLAVLFCMLLIKLYIQKIKNHSKVLYQKDVDFQIALNSAIIETQEQVLNHISQDLHDDAGQQLTYINFQIENLKLDSPEFNVVLEPLSESVHNLSKSIRSISHLLNNQLLMQQDLVKAIRAEAERLQNNDRIAIKFALKEPIKKTFSANEKIVIYRIFQEIINNSFKHSKATAINIDLQNVPRFKMTISDNGKGFDYDAKNKVITLGLQNMISRAAIINYKLSIVSIPEGGTTIILCENKIS